MKLFSVDPQKFRDYFRLQHSRHDLRFLFLGAVIGLVSGVVAIAFREAIGFISHLLLRSGTDESNIIDSLKQIPWWLCLVPIPVTGFIAWFTKNYAPEAEGHGVPEIMSAMATNRGVIRPRVAGIKLLASALSIGSGSSVGREGPTALIGATIGSFFGSLLKFPVQKMKMVVGCGAAAGVAATFNAPLAGTAFALELVVGHFNVRMLTPIILSAMIATVVTHHYYGHFHALFAQLNYEIGHPIEIVLYGFMGVVMGLSGAFFTKMLYFSEDLTRQINLPVFLKGCIGGAGIALILMFMPELSGPATWESINKTLVKGISQDIALMFIFVGIAKIFSTSWSLAWGSSGGIFAPSIMMGGSLGAGYGYAATQLLPDYADPPYSYSLIGMGAFVAAVTQAPLTAITIIFEMTNNMSIILPMFVSAAVAVGTFNHFVDGSIYTLKLKRRGLNIEWGRETGVLENVKVAAVFAPVEDFFYEETPLSDLLEKIKHATRSTMVVVDRDFTLKGLVSFWRIRELILEQDYEGKTVGDVMQLEIKYTTPEQNLYDVFVEISSGDFDFLPVIDNPQSMKLLGRISRHRLLQVYKNQLTLRGIIDAGETSGIKRI